MSGPKPTTMAPSGLLEAEDRRIAATLSNDAETLDALLAPDSSYVHVTGFRQSRSEYLGRVREGATHYLAIEREDTTVRAYGSTALIDGQVRLTYAPTPGTSKTIRNLYLAVWVDQGGAWKLAAYASTLKAAAP